MYIEYCYGPKWPYWIYIAYIGLVGTGFIQVFHLGRAPHTKETLPDFLKWRRVTRRPLVFRGLTGSQRTPGFWGVIAWIPRGRGAAAGVGRTAWALGAMPGRAGWLRAVHSVHSACFRSGLTRYCS